MDGNCTSDESEDRARWNDVRHELGNVALLVDAIARVTAFDDEGRRLIDDVKRRIDLLIDTCGDP